LSIQKEALKNLTADIIIIIISLKGGVAKSTTSCSIAEYLANRMKKKVVLLDMDITNPSAPKILGLAGRELTFNDNGNIEPVKQSPFLKVMSVDFFLPSSDQPILFDEDRKINHMIQFMKSVEFGKCDYVVIDTPPTTSPELFTILDLFKESNIRIVLTTQPGEASANSVQKSIKHLTTVGLPIAGIICNMDGFTCRHCGTYDPIFPRPTSIQDMARKYGIPFLGSIQLGTVQENEKKCLVINPVALAPVIKKILITKPVKFPPKYKDLTMFQKAMIARNMKKNLNAAIR